MKKKFTFLIAAIAAILMMALPMKVWAIDRTVTVSYSGIGSDAITGTSWSNQYVLHRWTGTSSDGTTVIYMGGTAAVQSNSFAIKNTASHMLGNINPSYDGNTNYNIPTGVVGAIPGKIKKIEVSFLSSTASGRGIYIHAGTSQIVGNSSAATGNGIVKSNRLSNTTGENVYVEYDVTQTAYTYFAITGGNSSYTGITSYTITYEEASSAPLSSISLSGTYPTSFYQDDAFSHEGMTVTATYDDASTANVTSSATFTGYNMSTPGEQTVTVSYTENNITKTASYTITVNALPQYTVTLSDDNTSLTEASAGAGVTLPTRSALNGYAFAGWSDTNVTLETTTAPTIIAAGIYYPTENITLYPVYTKSGGGTTPSAFSVGDTGDYAIVSAAQNSKYYALPTNPTVSSGKITGQEITVNELNNVKYVTPSNASGFTWTIASATNGYTLSDGTNYIYHSNGGSSGTNLAYGNSTSYTWNFTADGDYVTMAGMSGSTTNNRGMLFQGTTIGGYALSNASSSGYYKIMILPISAGSTTYYWSSPVAPTVEKPTITIAENPFLFSTTVTINCGTEGSSIKYRYNENDSWSDYTAPLTITETKTIYAKGVKGDDESTVAQATATKNLANPTVTVSGDLIVDLDGETNVNAGTLSATVTYNDEAVAGATVTWESNHTDIATIDASTGAVTLLTTGTVTFTATYAQNSDYDEATDTKTITVIDSKGPGSMYDPYTVAEARAAIDAGTGVTGVYAIGIVSEIVTEYSSIYHNISYNISTNGESSGDQLQSYRGKSYNGDNFTSSNDIKVGDIVVIYGNMKNYKGTYEFEQDNQLVSLVRPGTGGDPTTIAGTVVDFTINDESYTVAANTILTVTGTLVNNNAANLIIEDGGQLITSSQVKATFKKTTTASSESKAATTYWYAISSPIDKIAISTFATGTHNVYSYIEKSHYWNEYRGAENIALGTAPFTKLANGRGYLYRSTASGIDFKGDVNIEDATYTLSYTAENGDLAGFNLIGNPFSYNIYKGVDIPNTDLEGNFYTLTPSGGWELGYDSGATEPTAIKPNTGILVQAKSTANGQTLTIAKTRNGGVSKYDNDQISFKVENSDYYDVACVQFKDGRGLNKIEHRNAEIPMLYIMNNGENFGAANMPDNTSVINLGFEAKTMGEYTISLKAEGQYSYMHLIDKLTGNDIDMLVEDSYTFVGTPNDRNDRFVLRLNYNAAGIDTESDIFAYQSGNEIIISGEGELQVFDITGRKVMTTDINGVETINGMNRGVYIFRLNEKTQKIVVR